MKYEHQITRAKLVIETIEPILFSNACVINRLTKWPVVCRMSRASGINEGNARMKAKTLHFAHFIFLCGVPHRRLLCSTNVHVIIAEVCA